MLTYLTTAPAITFQEHWRSTYHLCHPCSVQYDYVGRFNDLANDSQRILDKAVNRNGTRRYKFPRVIRSKTDGLMKQFLKYLSPELIANVHKVFKLDYDMFGYT